MIAVLGEFEVLSAQHLVPSDIHIDLQSNYFAAFSALRDHIGWRRSMAVLGAFQGSIVICGALLRPIIIKPRETEDILSPKEHEALSMQEGTDRQDCVTSDTSHSAENELTGCSESTEDSAVQSLKNGSSPQETILQDGEEILGTKVASVENGSLGVRKPEEKEEKKVVAENQKINEKEIKTDGGTGPFRMSKLLDVSILKEPSFILYSLFGLFATIGFLAPPLYVIELSVSRGVERERATYMLSAMAVAEIFGRFCIGWILSRRRLMDKKLLVLLVCVVVMGVDLLGFTLVTEFYGLAVCCAVYGFTMGTLACTHIPMLAEDDVVGIDRMSSAAGVYVYIQSFAGLAGPPLGGKKGVHCCF